MGHDFFDELKGGHNFCDELKGGRQFFCSFIFKSGFLCLTMFFLNNLQFLTKMGNEIAYVMPIKYQIFLAPWTLALRTPRSQTILPTSMRKGLMTVGGI